VSPVSPAKRATAAAWNQCVVKWIVPSAKGVVLQAFNRNLKANSNLVLFAAGLALVAYGAWQLSPYKACIVCGSIVMGGVAIDAAVKIAFNLKERK